MKRVISLVGMLTVAALVVPTTEARIQAPLLGAPDLCSGDYTREATVVEICGKRDEEGNVPDLSGVNYLTYSEDLSTWTPVGSVEVNKGLIFHETFEGFETLRENGAETISDSPLLRDNTFTGSPGRLVYEEGVGQVEDQDFSISFWLKVNSFGASTENNILNSDSTAPHYQFTITDDSGKEGHVRALLNDGVGGIDYAYSPSPVVLGEWHHVVLTVDRAGDALIYLDGIPGTAEPVGAVGSLTDPTQKLILFVSDGNIQKSLRDFRLYSDMVLTQTQVNALYAKQPTLPLRLKATPVGPSQGGATTRLTQPVGSSNNYVHQTTASLDPGDYELSFWAKSADGQPQRVAVHASGATDGVVPSDSYAEDGGFESWTNPENLTHWSKSVSSGCSLDQSTDSYFGDYAAQATVVGSGTVVEMYGDCEAVPAGRALFVTMMMKHATSSANSPSTYLRIREYSDGACATQIGLKTIEHRTTKITDWTQMGGLFSEFASSANSYLVNIVEAGDDVTTTFDFLQVQYPTASQLTAAQTGMNLIADPMMEKAGTADWSAGNNAVLSKVADSPSGAGSQVLKVVSDNVTGNPYTYQSTLTVGKRYRITGWMKSSAFSYALSGGVTAVPTVVRSTWSPIDYAFTAGSTSLAFYHSVTPATQEMFLDEIVVTELDDNRYPYNAHCECVTPIPCSCTAEQDAFEIKSFDVGPEWKRYTTTASLRSAGTIDVRFIPGGTQPNDPGDVYVSRVQLRRKQDRKLYVSTTSAARTPKEFEKQNYTDSYKAHASLSHSGKHLPADVHCDMTDDLSDGVLSCKTSVGGDVDFLYKGTGSALADHDMETAGVAAWSTIRSPTVTKVAGSPGGSGSQVIRVLPNGVDAEPNIFQTVLTIGESYRVSGWVRGSTGSYIQDGVQLVLPSETRIDWTFFDVEFIARGNRVALFTEGSSAATYVEWDNIVVQPATYYSGRYPGGVRPFTNNRYPNNGQKGVIIDWDMEDAGTSAFSVGGAGTLSKQPGSPSGRGTQVIRTDGVSSGGVSISGVTDNRWDYRIRGWARHSGVGGVFFYVANSSGIPILRSDTIGAEAEAWYYFDTTFTSDGPALGLYCSHNSAGEWCEFDEIIIEQLGVSEAAIATGVNGESSRGLFLDGVAAEWDHLDNDTFDPTGDFSACVEYTPLETGSQRIVGKLGAGGIYGWTIYSNGSDVVCLVSTDGTLNNGVTSSFAQTGAILELGKPHQICCVYDYRPSGPNSIRLFVDSTFAANLSAVGPVYNIADSLSFGSDNSGGGFARGVISNFSYYNYPITYRNFQQRVFRRMRGDHKLDTSWSAPLATQVSPDLAPIRGPKMISNNVDSTQIGQRSFSNGGLYVPDQYTNYLSNASIENWLTTSNINHWSDVAAAPATLEQYTLDAYHGASSVKIVDAAGGNVQLIGTCVTEGVDETVHGSWMVKKLVQAGGTDVEVGILEYSDTSCTALLTGSTTIRDISTISDRGWDKLSHTQEPSDWNASTQGWRPYMIVRNGTSEILVDAGNYRVNATHDTDALCSDTTGVSATCTTPVVSLGKPYKSLPLHFSAKVTSPIDGAVSGPLVDGADVLVNGDFETGSVFPWSNINANLTIQSGARTGGAGSSIFRVEKTGGSVGYAAQFVVLPGKVYRARGWARGDGTGLPYIGSGNTYWEGTSTTSWQYFDVTFPHTTTSHFRLYTQTTGQYTEWDDVELLETSQLVSDSEMESSGTTYIWTATNSAILSKEAGSPAGSGSQVLRVTQTTDWGDASQVMESIIDGETYVVEGWYRTDGSATANFRLNASTSVTLGSSSDWVYFSETTTGDSTQTLRLQKSNATGNWVEFDNVTVTQVGVAPRRYIAHIPATGTANENRVDFYWDSDTLYLDAYDSTGSLTTATIAAPGDANTEYEAEFYLGESGYVWACWDGTCGTYQSGVTFGDFAETIYLGNNGTAGGEVWLRDVKLENVGGDITPVALPSRSSVQRSLGFEPIDGYRLLDSDEQDVFDQEHTIAFIFTPSSKVPGTQYIFEKSVTNVSGIRSRFLSSGATGSFTVEYFKAGGSTFFVQTLTSGVPYVVHVTRDANNVGRLYLNGKLVYYKNLDTYGVDSTDSLNIPPPVDTLRSAIPLAYFRLDNDDMTPAEVQTEAALLLRSDINDTIFTNSRATMKYAHVGDRIALIPPGVTLDNEQGLSPEQQRTQLVTNTDNFDDWVTASGTTIELVPNAGVAPDGSEDAWLWKEYAEAGAHYIWYTYPATIGRKYTCSVYIKPLDGEAISFFDNVNIPKPRILINLQSMEVVDSISSPDYGVKPIGNGWYRVWMTHRVTRTTAGGESSCYIHQTDPGEYTYSTYEATDRNAFLLWGPQIEEGAFPTSWIRNETSGTMTRAADNLVARVQRRQDWRTFDGVDVLTDGDQEAVGTGSWSAITATLTKEPGTRPGGTGSQVLRIEKTGPSGAATQTILETGHYYRVRGWGRSVDGVNSPGIFPGIGFSWLGSNSTDWQYFDDVSKATGTSFRLYSAGAIGGIVEFDDVTVEKVIGHNSLGENVHDDWNMEIPDTSDWSAISSAVLTKEPGACPGCAGSRVLRSAYGGVPNPVFAYAPTALTLNRVYRTRGWVKCSSTGYPRVVSGSIVAWSGEVTTDWQKFDVRFLNEASFPSFQLLGSDGYCDWDNVTMQLVELDGDIEDAEPLPGKFCATCPAKKLTLQLEAKCEFADADQMPTSGGSVLAGYLLNLGNTEGFNTTTLNSLQMSVGVAGTSAVYFELRDNAGTVRTATTAADVVDYSKWHTYKWHIDFSDHANMEASIDGDTGIFSYSNNSGSSDYYTYDAEVMVGRSIDGAVLSGSCSVRNLQIVPGNL